MALADSVERFASTALSVLRSRLELAAIDIEDELRALILVVLAGSAAITLAVFAALFGAFAIVALYWETHRITALLGVAFFFAVISGLIVISLTRFLRNRAPFLGATLSELDKDKQRLGLS
jgi:uncharacterized membrane protein YqjE